MPLDVRVMQRRGVLRNGYSDGWYWTWSSGESAGSIGVTVDGDVLRLSYSVNGEQRTQHVPIVRTACNFGGTRPWFRCPVCGRRMAVLYMRAGRFACLLSAKSQIKRTPAPDRTHGGGDRVSI